MRPFASDVYRTMAELFEQFASATGMTLDELLAIPSGQVAAAAMPANISERDEELIQEENQEEEDKDSPEAIRRRIALKRRQQNAIAGVFLIDAGDNVEDLLGLVEKLEDAVLNGGYVRRTSEIEGTQLVRLLPPRPGRPEIEYFERDDTVVLGLGHDTASKVLDQWLDRSEEKTLADRSDFASVMSRCVGAEETRPQMTFFVDPYHFVERLVKRGGAAALVWPIIEELGISKIRGVGGSTFTGGEIFEGIMHVHRLDRSTSRWFLWSPSSRDWRIDASQVDSGRCLGLHLDQLGLRNDLRQFRQSAREVSRCRAPQTLYRGSGAATIGHFNSRRGARESNRSLRQLRMARTSRQAQQPNASLCVGTQGFDSSQECDRQTS